MIHRIVRQDFNAAFSHAQKMLELYRVMVDLQGDDHVLFECHSIFFGIVAAQPGRFIDTQPHAVEAIETRKLGWTVLAETGEEFRATVPV